MEIRPILSALMRNHLGAALVALQIAVTMAILCNGAFIVYQRIETMTRDTGMDVANIFTIDSQPIGSEYDEESATWRDLEVIRSIPGVVAATTTNSYPLSGGGWGEGLRPSPDREQASITANLYFMDEQGLETLGVELAKGRDFDPTELYIRGRNDSKLPQVGIITQALADELFPDDDALGKLIYPGEDPVEVVGILRKMQGSWLGWSGVERVFLVPGLLLDGYVRYMIRTEPGKRDELMPLVEEALAQADSQRILRRMRTLEEYRANSYNSDRTMAVVLSTVMGLLIIVTGLGIVGLVSFLVNQRTKQIGTRRALGAQRFHVVRYFLVENWLITSIGLTLGLAMTVGLNYWMVHSFDMERLDWIYIPIGLVLIWTLGIGSALGPARRASRVPPAVATRTV
ncbi:MAG: FtsX-like permease family protein [Xanthomonadales bacterium]|nr:FtsX-like permease family protein [Xanthomonadales bacterium]